MLKAPDFEQVYGWRQQQEEHLFKHNDSEATNSIMNAAELRRFIMHFERITRHDLEHLAAHADIILPLSAAHDISQIIIT